MVSSPIFQSLIIKRNSSWQTSNHVLHNALPLRDYLFRCCARAINAQCFAPSRSLHCLCRRGYAVAPAGDGIVGDQETAEARQGAA